MRGWTRLWRRCWRDMAQRFGTSADVCSLRTPSVLKPRAALVGPERVERRVHRDPIQPGEEVGAAVELRQTAIRAHERLLSRIVRVAVVTEDMKSGCVHASLMAPNEATECFSIALASPLEVGVLVSHSGAL